MISDKELVEQVRLRFNEKFRQNDTPWLRHDFPPLVKPLAELLMARSGEPQLLDIGCGNGWLTIYFAEAGIEAFGIDGSEIAIAAANQEARKRDLANVHFLVGNGLNWPYAANAFDAVFDRGFLHHVPKSMWPDYLAHLKRVLRPGGYFYLEVFGEDSQKRGIHPAKDGKFSLSTFEPQFNYWTHDEFFTKERVLDTFGADFLMLKEHYDKERSAAGGQLRSFIMQKEVT